MKIHDLKTLPEYFEAVDSGAKPFEVRFNDRDFKVGDLLCLREYVDGEHTGRALYREVTYVLSNPDYCKEGFVVLGLGHVIGEEDTRELFEDLERADKRVRDLCVGKQCERCPYYYVKSDCHNTIKAEYLYRKGWRRKGGSGYEQREAD